MQENIINPNSCVDETSISCFTTCKICKKTFSTNSEYKMHIKEHRKVCRIICSIYVWYVYFIITIYF